MTTITTATEVYAQGGIMPHRAVVLDSARWRYWAQDCRPRHYVVESERRLRQRGGPGSGLLVLRPVFDHGDAENVPDAVLTGLATEIVKLGALGALKMHGRWDPWVRAQMDLHRLEAVVVDPDSIGLPWPEHERREAERDVIAAAEGITEDVIEAARETEEKRLKAEVERRLLRAGVTFTTAPKPPHDVTRHRVTGKALNFAGKVMPEADVHEGVDPDEVVMSYATLLRLLEKIDPRAESDR